MDLECLMRLLASNGVKRAKRFAWYGIVEPLTFDRVIERHTRRKSSSNILFDLPVEILSIVLQHVPDRSLASLALTSWDCCQLARSRQFKIVSLDFSSNSIALVRKLEEEGNERVNNGGRTVKPSLGICIRNFTVSTEPRSLEELSDEFHQTVHPDSDDFYNDNALREMVAIYDISLRNLGSAMQNGAMPHLESLEWFDPMPIGNDIWEKFISAPTPLRRLGLRSMPLYTDKFAVPKAPTQWKVLDLVLDVRDYSEQEDAKPLRFYQTIFRLCASYLQRLDWTVVMRPEDDWGMDLPVLKKLTELRLSTAFPQMLPMLKAARTQLRVLEIFGNIPTETIPRFVDTMDTMPALTTLSFVVEDFAPWQQLLERNAHITKLKIRTNKLDDTEHERILESIVDIFTVKTASALKSLSIGWEGMKLREKTLAILGRLTTLEQLEIEIADYFAANHAVIIRHLSRLHALKRFALVGDTYHWTYFGEEGSPLEYYYDYRKKDEGFEDEIGDGDMEVDLERGEASEGGEIEEIEAEEELDGEDGEEEMAAEEELDGEDGEEEMAAEEEEEMAEDEEEETAVEGEENEEGGEGSEQEAVQILPNRSLLDMLFGSSAEASEAERTDDDFDEEGYYPALEEHIQQHSMRMVKRAKLYVPHFPNLEWISFGKLVMLCHPEHRRFSVVPQWHDGSVYKVMRTCPFGPAGRASTLERMFGWPFDTYEPSMEENDFWEDEDMDGSDLS